MGKVFNNKINGNLIHFWSFLVVDINFKKTIGQKLKMIPYNTVQMSGLWIVRYIFSLISVYKEFLFTYPVNFFIINAWTIVLAKQRAGLSALKNRRARVQIPWLLGFFLLPLLSFQITCNKMDYNPVPTLMEWL